MVVNLDARPTFRAHSSQTTGQGKGVRSYTNWQSLIDNKIDYIITYPHTSLIGEVKKNYDRTYLDQITDYLNRFIIEQKSQLSWIAILRPLEKAPSQKVLWQSLESIASTQFQVIYNDRQNIYRLLGKQGELLLKKVINLIKDEAVEESWPITKLEISYVRDPEKSSWEYVLLVLHSHSDFETADRYLHHFYQQLDDLNSKLGVEEKDILLGKLFFDVGTTVLSH